MNAKNRSGRVRWSAERKKLSKKLTSGRFLSDANERRKSSTDDNKVISGGQINVLAMQNGYDNRLCLHIRFWIATAHTLTHTHTHTHTHAHHMQVKIIQKKVTHIAKEQSQQR